MLRRIPVSLKFDDETESEFYYNLIEQKRIDRELTNLICDLLHVYYENEDVRTTVDNYQNEKNPYLLIQENLKRIAIEHSRNVMSASILSDYTENEKRNLEKAKEAEQKSRDDSSKSGFTEEEMYSQLDATPALLEGIKDRYNLTEKGETDSTEIETPIIEEKELVESMPVAKEDTVIEGTGGLSVGPIKFMDDFIEPEAEPIATEKKSNDFVLDISNEEVGEKVDSVDESVKEEKREEVVSQPKVRKPASFGKLMKSMETEN